MGNPRQELDKRLNLAHALCNEYGQDARGVLISGSVAYADDVRNDSDLDLIVFSDHIKQSILNHAFPEDEIRALKHRYFEGYCFKSKHEDIPVSVHILSMDALNIISRCFVANIRVYRSVPKPETYYLYGFEENCYPYVIKNIELPDLQGVRTIVPISFIHQDRYFLGIHRDKLLSKPIILHDEKGMVEKLVDYTWGVVVENLVDESYRIYGDLDLKKMNVINALAKNHRFSDETISHINERTRFCLSRLL